MDDIGKTASDASDMTHDVDNELKLVKEEVESLKNRNMDLANKLYDSINRNMRGNLFFLNIPEEEGENPVRTKQILSEELANNFTQKSPEIILQHIVRAHRSPPRPGNKSPRPIFCKIHKRRHCRRY